MERTWVYESCSRWKASPILECNVIVKCISIWLSQQDFSHVQLLHEEIEVQVK